MNDLEALQRYGEEGVSFDVTQDIVGSSRRFFLALYGRKDFIGTLDELRAHLFVNTKLKLQSLPPTEDAHYQHLLRSLHQIIVWKRAHLSEPMYPVATNFGRQIISGKLVPILMLKPSKPEILQQSKFCKCRKGRCLKGCICAKAHVKCVFGCMCTADPRLCGRIQLESIELESDNSD